MAIVPLKKVTITALNKDREDILNALQDYGQMHIDSVIDEDELYTQEFSDTVTSIDELDATLNDIKTTIKDLSQYDDREKQMLAPLPEMTLAQLEDIVGNSQQAYDIVAEHIQDKNQSMELRSDVLRYESSINQIHPWHDLGVDIANIMDTATTRIMVGTVPVLDFTEFSGKIDEITLAEHEKIYTDRDSVYVLLMHHNNSNQEVTDAMFVHSFSKYTFPFDDGTPEQQLEKLYTKIKDIKITQKKLKTAEEKRAKHLTEVEQLYDAISIRLNMLEQVHHFGGTDYVFVMEGYIPASEIEAFSAILSSCVGDKYDLNISEPAEDASPTLYKNNKAVEPFESVTNMFATSKTESFDPNVLMAPFFGLFFGMMLSDAGYGIILTLSAAFIYYRTRNSQGKGNSLLAVLAISGISTIFWGIMFGGFMGFSFRPILFNPLDEPILTLGLSLLLGVIQIIVGMVVRAVMMIRRGKVMEAISHQFTWILLIVGLVTFAFPKSYMFIGESPSAGVEAIGSVGLIVTLVGLAGLIILGGYGKKGLGRVFGGVSSLMDITGYLSDILSYARLFGLGLATGVIGMVINEIAKMLTGGGVIGWIAAVVVFAGVHIFNLAINALGAYVHSSRLQYVEFFGKFFVDGGIKYRRFEPETKYFNIKKLTK